MKKMSFWMSLFMAVGSIIGAGIFSKTTLVIRLVGDGLVLGFLLAAIFVFLKTIPEVVLSSALPANGAAYMHLTRLLHPVLGIIHSFNQVVIGTMNVGIMSLTFSTYFAALVPNANPLVVGIIVALVFTALACFGVKIGGWIQNVCVAVLLAAILIFVGGGLSHVTVPFTKFLTPECPIGDLWAAMGLLHGSLIGANVLMYVADEIEKPGRTVPIVFIISTIFCAILFALMGYVGIGIIPLNEWLANWDLTLADVSSRYLSPAMQTFFIVGGPLLAVTTSMSALILMFSRSNLVAARDGLFPERMAHLNKFGAPVGAIWLNTIIVLCFMVLGFNLDDLLLITSIPGLVLNPVIFVAVFMLPKKYPYSYKASFLGFIPHWVNCVIVVVASVLSWLLGSYVIGKMKPSNWISMIVFYILAAIYTYCRYKYLKNKKGVDMFATMRAKYEPWEIQEAEAKAKVEAAAAAK